MKRSLSIVAGSLAAIGGLLLGANPASALVTDGADPQTSGCSADAYNVASWPAYDNAGVYKANIELRYSPKCGTNWVRVTQQDAAYKMTSSIRLDIPNGTYGPGTFARGVGNGYAYWWTGMVKAPGSTCVLIDASGNNAYFQTLNWTTKRVC